MLSGGLYEILCRAATTSLSSNGPDLLIRHYRLSASHGGTLDRLCKLDVEQHYNWIVYEGLGGRGCTRMRRKLHLPRAALGDAFRVTGTCVMA